MAGSEIGREALQIHVGVAVPDAGVAGRAAHTRLGAFCESLAAAVSAVAAPHGFAHYRELLAAMQDGEIDLAWLPPIVALRATSQGHTVPIALPVRNGASTFSSVLFTRPDSKIRAPEDLAGVRAAWVDRDSSAGYLVIRAALRAHGVDLARAFASESFLGTHEAVARAVLAGEADVGATFAQVDPIHGKVDNAGWKSAAVHVITHGGPIPSDVVAASTRLPEELIQALQAALCDPSRRDLARAAADLFGAEGFVAATAEHLAPLRHLLAYLDEARRPSSAPPPPPPKD